MYLRPASCGPSLPTNFRVIAVRTDIKRPRVSKGICNFIGQREAKKLHADVAIHVLQRQHRNGVLRAAPPSGAV